MGRTLAIGDIHGCVRSFDLLLSVVRPTQDDLVVTLGDYVDRGPSSRQVIDRLLELDQACRLIPLRGNHETMMIEARDGLLNARRWMISGGSETLDSYNGPDGQVAQIADIPKRHWRFLCERLVPYCETETFLFVHGCVDPEMPMEKQNNVMLEWTGFSTLNSKHCSGKRIVCGHETQHSGVPCCNEFGFCIDTGTWNGGWLTCLEPETGNVWQANERGESRRFVIENL
jgi:serine/threonine protein phosphatase 1